jgi:hypothetical protein
LEPDRRFRQNSLYFSLLSKHEIGDGFDPDCVHRQRNATGLTRVKTKTYASEVLDCRYRLQVHAGAYWL